MPPNVLLMAKLIVSLMLMKGYVAKIPPPFLPLVPGFELIPHPYAFQLLLQATFTAGAILLLVNVRVRTAAFVCGLVFLVGPLSSRGAYTNGQFFCAVVLMLSGLWTPAWGTPLLRAQIIIMYAGSALNKFFIDDWRSGQYMEHWLRNMQESSLYIQVSDALPQMMAARALCWGTIITEALLAALLLSRRTIPIAIWIAVIFHTISIVFARHDFAAFYGATLASYLLFVEWPDSNALLRWRATPGVRAFNRRLLHRPIFLFLCAAALGTPDTEWHWLHVALPLIGAVWFVPLTGRGLDRIIVRGRGTTPAVIYFDGVCNLCNGFVDFLIRHDARGTLRFAALQSPAGQSMGVKLETDRGVESVVLVRSGHIHRRSSAALRTMAELGGGWRLMRGFLLVPQPIRDAVYNTVASHRYKWFGRRDTCRVPSPEERSRFVDESAVDQ